MGFILTGIFYFSLRLVVRYFPFLHRYFNWRILFPSYPWGFVIEPLDLEVTVLGMNFFFFVCIGVAKFLWKDDWRLMQEVKLLWSGLFHSKRIKTRSIDYVSEVLMRETGDFFDYFWLMNLFVVGQSTLLYVLFDVIYKEPFAQMFSNKDKLPSSSTCDFDYPRKNGIGLEPIYSSVVQFNDSMLVWLWLWHCWMIVLQQLTAAVILQAFNNEVRLWRKCFPFLILIGTTWCRYYEDELIRITYSASKV